MHISRQHMHYVPHRLAELPLVQAAVRPSINAEAVALIHHVVSLIAIALVPQILPCHTYIHTYLLTCRASGLEETPFPFSLPFSHWPSHTSKLTNFFTPNPVGRSRTQQPSYTSPQNHDFTPVRKYGSVCMYVCMNECMYVCMYVCMNVCIYMQ